jgi:hypothetical protein
MVGEVAPMEGLCMVEQMLRVWRSACSPSRSAVCGRQVVRQGVSATVAVSGRVDVPPSLAANWTERKEGLRNAIYKKLTHVDSQFPEISVKLTREAQAGGDTRHDDGNKVVEITIHWYQ